MALAVENQEYSNGEHEERPHPPPHGRVIWPKKYQRHLNVDTQQTGNKGER